MVDVGTAYYIVSGICWPVVKLGGLGASYVGPMLGSAAQVSLPAAAVGGSVISTVQSATVGAATTAVGTIGIIPTATLGAVAYGVYRYMR